MEIAGTQVKSTVRKHGLEAITEAFAQKRAIADEGQFLQILSIERKRSERSNRPFVLVLLRSDDLFRGHAGKGVVRQFQRGTFSVVRDIDVAGWYENECALGIIFTEVGDPNESTTAAILERISQAMTQTLRPEQVAKIAITCHVFPDSPSEGSGDTDDKMRFYPDVPRTERHRRTAHIMKDTIDIIGSLFALLVLSPVFMVIAVLIKLTSKGPVLFRQTRVGQYGNTFTFLKFRSMYENNDSTVHQDYVTGFIAGQQGTESGENVFKIKDDPRVTAIGRFLRQTSVDELPQLFNVLAGEMSLVGPRPPLPYEVERYDIWHRRRILEVRPGITGLWQVSGRSKVTFDEMVRLDLMYAREWSIALDLKILWMTPRAVFRGDGAY